MPLTPFHLGPGLLFGLLLFRYIDFPTSLIASVIVDVEPILALASLNYLLLASYGWIKKPATS